VCRVCVRMWAARGAPRPSLVAAPLLWRRHEGVLLAAVGLVCDCLDNMADSVSHLRDAAYEMYDPGMARAGCTSSPQQCISY
jgi:hypothetical protein